jgi:osmotically-inducible protein OsmY
VQGVRQVHNELRVHDGSTTETIGDTRTVTPKVTK